MLNVRMKKTSLSLIGLKAIFKRFPSSTHACKYLTFGKAPQIIPSISFAILFKNVVVFMIKLVHAVDWMLCA